jgi:hypothetical protein
MSDDELIERFEDCTLSNADFHHEEHVRVAFLYLSRYPALQALGRFCTLLKRFAAAHGKTTLYHETVTWAYVLIVRERMARADDALQTWREFRAANRDLFDREPNILMKYYRPETLQSDLAKKAFVFPDVVLH